MDLRDRLVTESAPDLQDRLAESRPPEVRYRVLDDMANTAVFGYAGQHRIHDEMCAKELFFVGGHPESGTTWLQILLNAHPEVSCAGEGHFLTSLAPLLGSAMKEYNTVIRHKNRDVLQEFGEFPQFADKATGFLFVSAALLLLAASGKAGDVRVVGEKTPDNVTNLWYLADHFPAAKFIHILRDPRDCTVSTWYHNRRVSPEEVQDRFPTLGTFVPHVAQAWCYSIGKWERFGEAEPSRCAMVCYEDLVAGPHAELRRPFELFACELACSDDP
jgi:hypothetical protein